MSDQAAGSGSGAFDPTTQTFLMLAGDGVTNISVSVADVDNYYIESLSTCIAYGSQIGACFVMFIVVLALTPHAKLAKPTTAIHVAALAVGIPRMVLAALFFPSPWNEFYAAFSGDFSRVPAASYAMSVTTNTLTLLLVILVQVALILQAWAMAKIWRTVWKVVLGFISLLICLLALAFRLTFAVLLNRQTLRAEVVQESWVAEGMTVLSAMMICWFCAMFNAPLITHLVRNRGVLPSRRGLSPMEVLVMANGVLMVFPGRLCLNLWYNTPRS